MAGYELALLAVALGSDAFSVAVCVGLAGATTKQRIRLASGFGAFQFFMPIIGLFVGQMFARVTVFNQGINEFSGYLGGGLLIILGLSMIFKTIKEGFQCSPSIHNSTLALVMASIGVSIDALAVGFSLAIIGARLLLTVTIIGATAFAMTVIGLEVGNQVGKLVQNRAAILGGAILLGLGIRIIIAA